jgi:hypothetical protein
MSRSHTGSARRIVPPGGLAGEGASTAQVRDESCKGLFLALACWGQSNARHAQLLVPAIRLARSGRYFNGVCALAGLPVGAGSRPDKHEQDRAVAIGPPARCGPVMWGRHMVFEVLGALTFAAIVGVGIALCCMAVAAWLRGDRHD